jgi:hypothetical protein
MERRHNSLRIKPDCALSWSRSAVRRDIDQCSCRANAIVAIRPRNLNSFCCPGLQVRGHAKTNEAAYEQSDGGPQPQIRPSSESHPYPDRNHGSPDDARPSQHSKYQCCSLILINLVSTKSFHPIGHMNLQTDRRSCCCYRMRTSLRSLSTNFFATSAGGPSSISVFFVFSGI